MQRCKDTTNYLIQAAGRYISAHLTNICSKIEQGNGAYLLESAHKMPTPDTDTLNRIELQTLQEFITAFNYKYTLDNNCDDLINQKLIEMNLAITPHGLKKELYQ